MTADTAEFYIACLEIGNAIESFKKDLAEARTKADHEPATAARVLILVEEPILLLVQRMENALSRMRAAANQENADV